MAFVYRHIRLDTEETFYIGIGSEKTHARAYDKTERSRFWESITAKTEFRVQILFDNLTWEQACRKEIRLIKLFGRRDLAAGSLCNMTNGGEGAYGRKDSEKTLERKRRLYKEKPIWGPHRRHHTEEAKKKISEASKRMDRTGIGEKISIGKKGKPAHPKSKLNFLKAAMSHAHKLIDTETGTIYPSIAHAARSVGMSPSSLRRQISGIRRNKTTFKLLDNASI